MSDMLDTTQVRLRKGTKSCVECRQRKVRCTFSADSPSTCQQCAIRHQACTPQIHRRQALEKRRRPPSSYDRISRLEQQVAQLTAIVPATPDTEQDNDTSPLTAASIASPPTHLKLIFGQEHSSHQRSIASAGTSSQDSHLRHARSRLQPLVPSRQDVVNIARAAEPWLQVYHTLFPTSALIVSADDLTIKYDHVTSTDAHPVTLSAYLVALAITVLQIRDTASHGQWQSLGDPSRFIRAVMDTVQTAVFNNDELASTMDSIKSMILYSRLLLLVGDVRAMWLTMHRAMAHAEFMGLHRSLKATQHPQDDERSALFETLCSTDRMISMMFNLPSATKSYKLPPKRLVVGTGEVSLPAYLLELATIAISVQDIDEELAQGTLLQDVYDKILLADSKIRALACTAKPSWWTMPKDRLQPCDLAQYIHHYVLVRIHLHASMRKDPSGQFEYSRTAGMEACQNTIQRFLALRTLVPRGFPFMKLLHMHIFTVSVVLLLSGEHNTAMASHQQRTPLIANVVQALEFDSTPSGNEFAVEASSALRSLQAWLDAPSVQESLTLRVPMLGKVVIGKEHRNVTNRRTLLESPAEMDTTTMAPLDPTSQVFMDQDTMSWLAELDMGAVFHDSFFPVDGLAV